MRTKMLVVAAIGVCFIRGEVLRGQTARRVRLVLDQAHGEQPPPGQMDPIARKLGLEIQTSAESISSRALEGARILYLRAPSKEFTAVETEAIVGFVKSGGSLLRVLDEEGGEALDKTPVKELIRPVRMRATART